MILFGLPTQYALRAIMYRVDNIIKNRYKFTFKDVPCKIGDVLIFSQCLVHKSGNNSSNSVRFSIQIRFNDLSKKDGISKILKHKFNLQKSNKAI